MSNPNLIEPNSDVIMLSPKPMSYYDEIMDSVLSTPKYLINNDVNNDDNDDNDDDNDDGDNDDSVNDDNDDGDNDGDNNDNSNSNIPNSNSNMNVDPSQFIENEATETRSSDDIDYINDNEVKKELDEIDREEYVKFKIAENKRARILGIQAIKLKRKRAEENSEIMRADRCVYIYSAGFKKGQLCCFKREKNSFFCERHKSYGPTRLKKLGIEVPKVDNIDINQYKESLKKQFQLSAISSNSSNCYPSSTLDSYLN